MYCTNEEICFHSLGLHRCKKRKKHDEIEKGKERLREIKTNKK